MVNLSALEGGLDAASVTLPVDANAVASIRSRAWGSDTITGSRGFFEAGSVTVEYYFPVLFLALTLVGGCIGGGLRGRKDSNTDPSASLKTATVTGLLAGVVLTLAYGAGIRFGLPVPSAVTDVGAAFVAALGGYMGPAVMNLFGVLSTPAGDN